MFSFSAIAQERLRERKHRASELEERREKAEQQDRPDLAIEQEIRRTKDPATGRVPRERLQTVLKLVKKARAVHQAIPDTSSGGNVPAPQVLSSATWVERGPSNIGGRTRTLMFDPNDLTYKKVWAGGVGGGLWFTNDITVSSPAWANVDDFWANISVSCMAYNPANTQEFYVGTGEGWFNADALRGAGIWKTSDGGLNWTQLPNTASDVNFDYINKIVVNSSGHVFVATSSRYCNRGGIYRSTDGGGTWSLVLGTQGTSCTNSSCSGADLEIGADGRIYATLGIFDLGGIYSSTNGTTWTKLNVGGSGFPTTGYYRIEIACAPSDANRLYAMAHKSSNNKLLNIYTSANKGVSWTTCALPSWYDQSCTSASTDMTRTQAWYDLIIAVDPNVATTLLIGGVDLFKSTNTGGSWTQISSWWNGCGRQYVHADQHAIAYRPGSSSVAIFGNDGGVFYTATAANTTPAISSRNSGYNVTQFYACAMHPTAGQNYFIAGAQDNGTQQFTTAAVNSTVDVNGGDGAFCFIDQTNPTYQIASYVYNNYSRTSDNWAHSIDISTGSTGDFINPADYDDANHILYSSYSTTQLRRVSGITNATPNAPVQITLSGMTALATHIRVSPYAPATTTTLFIGTENGKLYKVTNAQASPTTTEISGSGSPWGTAASISCVEIGASESDLLVTFSNYGVTSVWRTTNGGANWSNKEGDLPDMPVRWAIYNPNNLNEVFLATEVGVWSTSDITTASPSWTVNNGNMANVRVDMFQLRTSDKMLLAATHGRGLFSSNVFAVVPAPVADFSGSSTTICAGNSVTFTDQSTNTPTSWNWTFAGGTPSSSTSQNPVVIYGAAGSYTVTLTATNAGGNNLKTKTNYIIVNSVPAITSSASSSICRGYPVLITASGGITYSWSPSSGLSATTGSSITSNATATTTYTIIGTAGNGCTNSSVTTITVNAMPAITSSLSSSICKGSSVIITASGGITYSWSPSTALSPATGPSVMTTATTTITYTVTGTDANGCTNKATSAVIVNTCITTTTLNLILFIQGYYDSGGLMQPVLLNQTIGASNTEVDTIHVELRDESNPSIIVASASAVLNTNGTATVIFNGVFTGNYWIAVKHRNALETWSNGAVSFSSPVTYDFSTSPNKALYDNEVFVDGKWAFYSGDLVSDGFIGVDDVTVTNNDNLAGLLYDYLTSDINGDGFVGVDDVSIVNNNNLQGIFFLAP